MTTTTARDLRWPLLRRLGASVSRTEHPAGVLAPHDDPPREAARIALPMLSGVADHLRTLCEEPTHSAAVREELATSLAELESLIQSVWSRAVTPAPPQPPMAGIDREDTP